MVRVVLNTRRRRANRRVQPSTPAKNDPSAGEKRIETAPSLEPISASDSSEEDDDFFIPDDDSPTLPNRQTPSYIPQYHAPISTSIRSSISLDRLDEESHEEKAMAILETFFFGGTPSTPLSLATETFVPLKNAGNNDKDLAATTISNNCELPASPTSTLIPPFPGSSVAQRQRYALASQSHSTTDLVKQEEKPCHSSVERTQSMPTMPPTAAIAASGSPARPKKPVLKRTGSSTCSLNSSKRNVSFTDVQFREYKVALSQHPSCSFGPPVELGWEYSEKETVPVEDYEGSRSPRREVHDLLLSYNARRRMLLKQAGYSKQELREAEREVDRVKRGRMVTEMFLPAQVIDEGLEKFVGFLKRTFRPENAGAACE